MIPVARQRHNNDDGGNKFSAARAHANFAYVGREVVEDWLTFLPRNLHWEKQKLKLEKEGEMALPQSLAILEEDEHEDDGDEGLKVAWQYKKSVQQQRAGLQHSTPSSSISQLVTSEIFCHSYDLSRCMSEQQPVDIDSHIVEMDIHKYERESLHTQALSMFRDLAALVANTKDEGKVIRLLLFHSDNALTAIVLPLLMVYIRKNYLPVVVLMCSTPTADQKSWFSLSRSADVVLSTEGFASRQEYPPPPEFRHLQGLLTLSVVSTITASTANGGGHFADVTMSRRPAAYLYGLKRDRRKLHIPLLHIPPEEYTEGGGSVGSGVRSGGGKKASESSSGNRPSGGMGCASNVGGNPLDF